MIIFFYNYRFINGKNKAKIQNDKETELAKMREAEFERKIKEKDAELERQAKIIQEMRQTNENKMDLMESKINKILDLMNKS